MRAERAALVAVVLATTASVFYVSLRFFATAQVVTRTDGSLSVSPADLPVQLGSLVAFLAVAVAGLYVTVRLLARPERTDRPADTNPQSSWRLYLHRLELPPFEEDEEDD